MPQPPETILIVDDEPMVLRLCSSILSRHGYQILAANSPEEALGLCREPASKPDLLLSDVIMPKVHGLELAERVRLILPDIRVLFMSGYDGKIIPEYADLVRKSLLIPKPFTHEELLSAVRRSFAD